MNLLALPVLVPLATAAALLLVRRPRGRTALSLLGAGGTLAASAWIAARALTGEVMVVQMGGWPAPYGISLVADRLTAIMLLLSGLTAGLTVVLAGATLAPAAGEGRAGLLDRAREAFGAQALLQFLFAGVNMAFLAGDLFNLYVAFEVMLVSSYGLLLLGGELPQLREGMKYVVINLVSSLLFVLAAGVAYGLVGSLNLADMARRLAEHGADPRVTLVALLLTLVFATKAAAFPLGFWLPDSYPAAPVAFGAFFAAVLTKVGAYALVRVHTLVFPAETLPGDALMLLGGVTVLVGALGAIARHRWRQLLSFVTVASTGYVLLGAFEGTIGGLAAALFYLVHAVLAVFALFALAALAERLAGRDVRAEGHLAVHPWLGVGVFVVGLAAAGLPPFGGFVGKFGVVRALLDGGGLHRAGAVSALLGGLLLLYAVGRVWRTFFWGDPERVRVVPQPAAMRGVAAAAVAATVAIAAFAGPLYGQTEATAAQLKDGAAYRRAVLDGPPPAGFDPEAASPPSEDAEGTP